VVHIPAGPEVPLPKQELVQYLPKFVQGIQEFSEQKGLRYDLIHSHYWMSGVAGGMLKEMWKTPIVHMFHTLGLMKQRVARLPGEAEGEYRLEGEREVLRIADRIVAATPAELAQIQWLYQVKTDHVVIIPPGVDTSRFYPIPPDEAKEYIGVPPCERMLLFVGRIEPLKGIDTLIQAIAIMRKMGVFVCLSVIGGEPNPSVETENTEMIRLKEMCEKAGLSDLVTFLGKRGQDTLPYYYSAVEAVVVPSHYESFGMVALEAMACGAPVVASQVGGLAYLVKDGETGFTVPVDDPQALAERLALLINDQSLRERLGRQAAQAAREYAWENIADRIIHVYQDLLGSEGV
jgi:D-inositol-3-phosphate glycosyltransferase